MKAASVAFKTARDLQTVTGTIRLCKIYAGVPVFASETDITLLLEQNSISLITNRIERNLNEFQPSTVSIRCYNDGTFLNSAGTGLFDPTQLGTPYQCKIWVGLTGIDFINPATPNALMFDGKIDPKSIKRNDRNTIEFSVYGWLKNAEEHNAEEIANKDSPPFRNITGLSFVSITDHPGAKGAKQMDYTFDSDGNKWLSFDGGELVQITGDGNYDLVDSIKENRITVLTDFSEMPADNQTDYFTVIPDAGNLIACYWWENIKLETIVSKLFDKISVTTQDIDVRELETGLEKQFIYLASIIPPQTSNQAKVTCMRVVSYNAGTHEITLLVGLEVLENNYNYAYKLVIDVDDPSSYTYVRIPTAEIVGRFCQIAYFNGRYWLISGNQIDYYVSGGETYRHWYTRRLDRLAVNLESVDKTVVVPLINGVNVKHWHLAYSFSGDEANSYIYSIRVEYAVPPGSWYVRLWKYEDTTTTWSPAFLPLGTLEVNELCENHGIYCKQKIGGIVKELFYYVMRERSDVTAVHIKYRNITDSVNVLLSSLVGDETTGRTKEITWKERAPNMKNEVWLTYFKGADSTYKLYRLYAPTIITYNMGTLYAKRYLHRNDILDTQYCGWSIGWANKWQIESWSPTLGSKITETLGLMSSYDGELIAPQIYKEISPLNFEYCGFVSDGVTLTPFIFKGDSLPTIRLADFTGYSVRTALTKLAEGYLDTVDIYEIDKARFYYRETFNGADAFDWDFYRHTPTIEQWSNFCDGVIVENSREKIRARVGNTGYGAKVIKIDNRFISEGTAHPVAQWMFNFFNRHRRIITVKTPFYVEVELMDKVTITLRNADGTLYEAIDTIVYETSFDPSPVKDSTHDMTLRLLEIQGTEIHIPILIPVPDHKLLMP